MASDGTGLAPLPLTPTSSYWVELILTYFNWLFIIMYDDFAKQLDIGLRVLIHNHCGTF